MVQELCNVRILTVGGRHDVDANVVKQCIEHSLKGTVEVRAKYAHNLIMLAHH